MQIKFDIFVIFKNLGDYAIKNEFDLKFDLLAEGLK